MTSAVRREQNKGWIIAALVAAVLFLGDIGVEAVSGELERVLEPYRIYVWSGLGLAFVAAIYMVVRDWRAKGDLSEEQTLSERNISTGAVDDSMLITGGDNVVAKGAERDVFRDKITDIHADGDVVQRDKHVHIHQPTIPLLSPLHQLPAPPRDFTGRQEEIEELLRETEKGVTISGLQGQGGVGKTALALKLAAEIKSRYPDAQFFLDLKGVSDRPLSTGEAMAHVIRAFHPKSRLPEEEAQLSALYNSVLSDKRALIVMDNARDRAQVEPLIPPDGCMMIVTSRFHFTLPGMREKDLDTLPPPDARKLLLKIAERIGDRADEIAGLCGYLPLALRVAASALNDKHRNLSAADYGRRLSDAKRRLGHLPEVNAALSVSYELIGEERQRLWRGLAVFPGEFDDPAAAAVWEVEADAATDALGDLLSYSLIEYDDKARRYSLHDLARLFADERLNDEERHALKRSHAMHYGRVLAASDDLYLEGRESVARGLALFDLERGNIEVGWAWAKSLIETDEHAAELCIAYPNAGAYVLNLRQHPRERIRWLESQLVAARRLKRREAEGAALGNLGLAYADLGETRKAMEFYEQALVIYREIGDRRREGEVLGNLGNAYAALGETRMAIEFYEQRLVIAREIGDRRGEGNALGNLGLAYADLGEMPKAIEFYEQALVIDREIGNRRGESIALWNMSLALDQLGERARAIESADASLKIKDEIEDPWADKVRTQLAEWRAESQQ